MVAGQLACMRGDSNTATKETAAKEKAQGNTHQPHTKLEHGLGLCRHRLGSRAIASQIGKRRALLGLKG